MAFDNEEFHNGKVAYENAVIALNNLFKALPEKVVKEFYKIEEKKPSKARKKKIEPDYFPNFLKEFTYLVQYALFDINTKKINENDDVPIDLVLSNKAKLETVSYLETLYIADLGDIQNYRLDRFIKESREKRKEYAQRWTFLCCSDNLPNEILKMKSALYEFVEPLRIKFVKSIAVLTIANSKEVYIPLLENLQKYLDDIFYGFARVDEREKKEDIKPSYDMFINYFFGDLKEYRGKVKSLLE